MFLIFHPVEYILGYHLNVFHLEVNLFSRVQTYFTQYLPPKHTVYLPSEFFVIQRSHARQNARCCGQHRRIEQKILMQGVSFHGQFKCALLQVPNLLDLLRTYLCRLHSVPDDCVKLLDVRLWEFKLKVVLKHRQHVKLKLDGLAVDLFLDLFKGTLDPFCLRIDCGCFFVEILLVGVYAGMSVLNFGSYVMSHCCAEEHLELSEWNFAAVEAEDLNCHQLASWVKLEITVDLIDELETLRPM